MTNSLRMLHIMFAGLLSCMWLYFIFTASPNAQPNETPKSSTPPTTKQSELVKPKPTKIQLMAVGDIMMHGMQIKSGETKTGYDFTPFFKFVAPILGQADLALGNLETTLAGAAAKFTGYPMFNAPDELALALKKANFDVITTSNNHSLDRGEKGLLRTIEQLKKHGFHQTGTFTSKSARDQPLIVTVKDIKIAILAYTYGTNGIKIPDGKPYLVNLLDPNLMAADIKKAKSLGADLVTVLPHFGNEYWRKPSDQQKTVVNSLFKAGADLILGSHPHVVQPYEIRQIKDANGNIRTGVVIYSLGNFIANQLDHPKNIGGIFAVSISKENGVTKIGNTKFIPTYVNRYYAQGKPVFNVLPMLQTLQNKSYPPFKTKDYQRLQNYYTEIMKHVTSNP